MAHRTDKKRLAELLVELDTAVDHVLDLVQEIRDTCGVKAPSGDLG